MKLLHFADLHLGIENYGTLDPSTGMSTRVHDFLRAFDAIVERAIHDEVDAVLFAGDAFKNRDPSPTIQREFAKRVGRLARADIPVVLLVGNHDLPNTSLRATPTEIYQILEVPGIYVCRQIELLTILTRSGPLQVVALPWLPRSLVLARDDYRGLSSDELDRKMAEGVTAALRRQAESLDPAIPAVLLAHLSVQGATLGYEQSIMLGGDVIVSRDELQAPAFDYVALGHIHKHQTLGVKPPAVYAGSPERVDFGEARETKGFVLVTIETGAAGTRETNWEFVALPARRFLTLRVNAPGDDPLAIVERETRNAARDLLDAIVRCYITVDAGRERSVPAHEARRMLLAEGAAFVAHVIIESEQVARARMQVTDETMQDSLHMLQQWLEMRDIDASQRARVLAKGRALIARRRDRLDGGAATHG